MLKIHRKLEYALLALKYMAAQDASQPVRAKEIAAARHIPFDAVSRVLQKLSQKGILRSEHGAQGGYYLNADFNEVSFYDVVESILGPIEIVKCASREATCELIAQCDLQSPLLDLNEQLKEFYQSLSLQKLLKIKSVNKSLDKNILQMQEVQ